MPRSTPLPRKPAEYAAFLNEHVFYEIDTLARSARVFREAIADDHARNLELEAAAIHGRALFDFLRNDRRHADDATADEFAPGFVCNWGSGTTTLNQLRERSNKEIAHLTWQRKMPGDATKDWNESLVVAVLKEAQRFWTAASALPAVSAFPQSAVVFLGVQGVQGAGPQPAVQGVTGIAGGGVAPALPNPIVSGVRGVGSMTSSAATVTPSRFQPSTGRKPTT